MIFFKYIIFCLYVIQNTGWQVKRMNSRKEQNTSKLIFINPVKRCMPLVAATQSILSSIVKRKIMCKTTALHSSVI